MLRGHVRRAVDPAGDLAGGEQAGNGLRDHVQHLSGRIAPQSAIGGIEGNAARKA